MLQYSFYCLESTSVPPHSPGPTQTEPSLQFCISAQTGLSLLLLTTTQKHLILEAGMLI